MRIGISRTTEWLTINKLVDWLDKRLAHHHALANYKPREQPTAYAEGRVFTDEERAAGQAFMKKLATELAESFRRKTESAPRQEAAE